MKDPQELLAKKETDLARVRKEIESLQLVLPLLAEEKKPPESATRAAAAPEATGTEDAAPPAGRFRFWRFGKRRRDR